MDLIHLNSKGVFIRAFLLYLAFGVAIFVVLNVVHGYELRTFEVRVTACAPDVYSVMVNEALPEEMLLKEHTLELQTYRGMMEKRVFFKKVVGDGGVRDSCCQYQMIIGRDKLSLNDKSVFHVGDVFSFSKYEQTDRKLVHEFFDYRFQEQMK